MSWNLVKLQVDNVFLINVHFDLIGKYDVWFKKMLVLLLLLLLLIFLFINLKKKKLFNEM